MVSKEHSDKTGQLTLASGDSEHAYSFQEAMKWGNKMNFSFWANYVAMQSCMMALLKKSRILTQIKQFIEAISNLDCFSPTNT